MWTPARLLAFTALHLQVTTCYQSCTLDDLKADCASQQHSWVPTLPPNITHLFLQANNIHEINSSSLQRYNQLQLLNLCCQEVSLVIRSNAFLQQSRLIVLILGFNRGLQLEPRAFVGLSNLQSLRLYRCDLGDSILADNFLEPLLSLEMLDLFGNNIVKARPGLFFTRLTKLTHLNLKLNKIEQLCEDDLIGFWGKHFTVLDLNSNHLYVGYNAEFDWPRCGNPFRWMTFNTLDLSTTGLNEDRSRRFFNAIAGTPIAHLIMSGPIGKGFSFNNSPDPDQHTFAGLANSSVSVLDVSKSFIFALQKAFLSPLQSVIIVDLSINKIAQINRNAFDGLQGHLRLLNLSSNLLGHIYEHTFVNLTDLRVLDLSSNHIGVLGFRAFNYLPYLRALYLTGNSLRELGNPAPLPNLDYLLLGDNKLRSLRSLIELGNNSLHVDVTDNRLENLEDIYDILSHFGRLENLMYGGNFIRWCSLVPKGTVSRNNSLQILDLHHSSLNIIWAQGLCLDLFDPLEKLLGLNLSFNSLETLPPGIFSGLVSIIEIDLSYNSLTYLQSDLFPASLIRLDLSNNFIASPDPKVFQSLSFFSLDANWFHCDCNLESFLKWLNETNVTFLSPVENFKCQFPAALHNVPLLKYSTVVTPCEEDDEKAVQGLKLVLFIFTAAFTVTAVLGGIIYARLRGRIFIMYKKLVALVVEGPRAAPPVDQVQYDAFFCFSNNDYSWVEAALLKKLDNQFSEENVFHCCFEARDFLPGEDHLSNIRDAIWGSKKTVCIVSKEFLKDGWCLEAFKLAQGRTLEELKNVLIMLVVGKVAHYQLMKFNAVRAFVQKREYLIWPEDPQDLGWFYERLVSQMLKDTKVNKLEETPEAAAPEPQLPGEDGIQLEEIREIAM